MRIWAVGALVIVTVACEAGGPAPDPIEITVPDGASMTVVIDTLATRGIVGQPRLFGLYARLKKADRQVRSGRYALVPGEDWSAILITLTEGRILTVPLTIPEGLTLPQIAERIAPVSGVPAEAVLELIEGDSAHLEHGVPGPGLEGYLFPETYRFAEDTPAARIVVTLTSAYREFWNDSTRARLDSIALTEREATTLASIIQAEARRSEEMPLISSVYHNRLRRGWLLQADPTVIYALGGHRERLLFAAIDSVADHPYNTYTQPGLPPGPIGAPGRAALEAALYPDEAEFMYFVATPGGTHVFTRTLAEHNRAAARARRAWDSIRASSEGS